MTSTRQLEWPRIYLDHNATTPLDPRVGEAMAPFWGVRFGNPHARENARGWRTAEALDGARRVIAETIGAASSEIVFTSGATEANNLAIAGLFRQNGAPGHVITSAIEHPSVRRVVDYGLAKHTRASILPVASDGRIDPAAVGEAIQETTLLVSIQMANHEIGVLQPIRDIGTLCRERNITFHVDAAQTLGKVDIDVDRLRVDLMSFSAHKLYGPMGIGALYVRRGVMLAPLLHGGGQEGGLRSGTVPLPLAVGFAAACKIAVETLGPERERVAELRDRLWTRLSASVPGICCSGSMTHRLPGTLNVTLPDVRADDLMLEVPEVALSSGAACASVQPEPSPVLRAIGLSVEETARSLRFGLGRFSTETEVDEAVQLITGAWRKLAHD